jgi:hypothetical protein
MFINYFYINKHIVSCPFFGSAHKESTMLKPHEVLFKASQKEEENLAFRSYLKTHADPDELDSQFLRLHKELFSHYDCNACRNCCRECSATFSETEIPLSARQCGMTPEAFKTTYLHQNQDDTYDTLHQPCDFLQKDGSCLLGDHKPASCTDFPFTSRPGRILSLLQIVQNASVCPVLFEILERLKAEYGFRYH